MHTACRNAVPGPASGAGQFSRRTGTHLLSGPKGLLRLSILLLEPDFPLCVAVVPFIWPVHFSALSPGRLRHATAGMYNTECRQAEQATWYMQSLTRAHFTGRWTYASACIQKFPPRTNVNFQVHLARHNQKQDARCALQTLKTLSLDIYGCQCAGTMQGLQDLPQICTSPGGAVLISSVQRGGAVTVSVSIERVSVSIKQAQLHHVAAQCSLRARDSGSCSRTCRPFPALHLPHSIGGAPATTCCP